MTKLTHALVAALSIIVLACGALISGQQSAGAQTAGAAPGLETTPLLGWSSWSMVKRNPSESVMEADALALHNSGLQKLGYNYVNMDDFYYVCPGKQGPDVDEYGRWVIDTAKFPPQGETDGIKALADYIHGLGLKFGMYMTPGISSQAVVKNTKIEGTPYTADQIAVPTHKEENYNCRGMVSIDYSKPGAQEYTNSLVNRFAKWGVDYIKLDGIEDYNGPDLEAWSKAIKQSGRAIVLDATEGDFTLALGPTISKYADQWEMAPDIECGRCARLHPELGYVLTSWPNIAKRFNYVADWQPYAGNGRWNDYDSIEVGNGVHDGLTPDERKSQLSLWALASAPLILGVDLTHLDPQDMQLLENKAVLAVNQDSIAAKRFVNTAGQQVFAKTEANGDVIVGLFNLGEKEGAVSVDASAVGLAKKGSYSLVDLWTGTKTKTSGSTITATVPSHGVALYRVKGH